MKRSLYFLIGFMLLWSATRVAADADDAARSDREKLRVERLARLGKAWGTVRYVHPFLAYQDLDWDAALVKAIPKVEAAKTKDEYAAAVGEMLAVLGDPATGVVSKDIAAKPTDGERHPVWSWVDDKILIVRITNYLDLEQDFVGIRQKIERLKAEIIKARGVVFDLRALTLGSYSGTATAILRPLANSLVSREAIGPAERSLLHSGYTPQTGMTSGGYFSAFVNSAATQFVPEAGAKAKRVAFVINGRSELPQVALVLQGSGDGAVIAESPISDAMFAGLRASIWAKASRPASVSRSMSPSPAGRARYALMFRLHRLPRRPRRSRRIRRR